MKSEFAEYVHPRHFGAFVDAAKEFNCHILVRKTGYASLSWVGKMGYTGKRADMKAKTANQHVGRYQLAGLVCSPWLQPSAFSASRIGKAREEWEHSKHLITVPRNAAGFDDRSRAVRCYTPYLLQTNPDHKHYGCVALVDCGLLLPRYIHGDYDLYAIIPAGQGCNPGPQQGKILSGQVGSTMAPQSLGLAERLRFAVPNLESALSFRVASSINNRIQAQSADLLGALMVNHGEQVNLGAPGQTFEEVLAVMPRTESGEWAKILRNKTEHEDFYRRA